MTDKLFLDDFYKKKEKNKSQNKFLSHVRIFDIFMVSMRVNSISLGFLIVGPTEQII